MNNKVQAVVAFAILAISIITFGSVFPGCGEGGGVDPLASATAIRVTEGDVDGVRRLTSESYLRGVVDSLGYGRMQADGLLRMAGFGRIIDDITTVDGIQIYDIETESLIREIAGRAEAQQAGQGKRVLACIYQMAADKYPAVAEDPSFSELRRIAKESPASQLSAKSFSYARRAVPTQTFSPGIEKAIRELGYVYADGHVSELSRIIITASKKPHSSFSRHLAASTSAEDAIRSFVADHVPPPSPNELMRTMMKETARYPAVMERSSFLEAITALDREAIGFDSASDTRLQRYRNVSGNLASRNAQESRINTAASRGVISESANAQNYVNYIATSLEAPIGAGESAQRVRSQRVGLGSGGYKVSGPSSAYRTRATTLGASVGSRSFGRARFSAKAGRGVSAGAGFSPPSGVSITSIAWVANPDDDQFGRFIVEVEEQGKGRRLARTRTMFADSALVAMDVLWGGHAGQTEYKEGDVLILMSMDPYAPIVGGKALEEAYRPFQRAQDAIEQYNELVDYAQANAMSMSDLKKEKLLRDLEAKEAEIKRLQDGITDADYQRREYAENLENLAAARGDRRIVIHPALHGSELAWSVARVDFWLNDLSRVSEESRQMSGQAMPFRFRSLSIENAQTWQYMDQETDVVLDSSSSRMPMLGVQSKFSGTAGADSLQSHITVMMYNVPESEQALDDRIAQFERLKNRSSSNGIVKLPDGTLLNESGELTLMPLTRKFQPMMDWLAVNHHDFVRLSDFYESFAILRWAKKSSVSPLIVDLDGFADTIPTPQRVHQSQGPYADEYRP